MSDRQKTLPTRVVGWFNTAKKEDLKLLFPILRDIYRRRTTEEAAKKEREVTEPTGTAAAAPKQRHRRTKAQIEEDKKKAPATGTAAFDG